MPVLVKNQHHVFDSIAIQLDNMAIKEDEQTQQQIHYYNT